MISRREAELSNIQESQAVCQFCRKVISAQNLQLHEARCERVLKNNPQAMKPFAVQSLIKAPFSVKERSSQIDDGFTQSMLADIKCSICNETFPSIELQQQHFQECNALNQNVQCDICKQEFPLFLYEEHIELCQSESSAQQYGQQKQQQPYQQQNQLQQPPQQQNPYQQYQLPYQQQQQFQQFQQQYQQQYNSQQIESNLYVDNSIIPNKNQQNNSFPINSERFDYPKPQLYNNQYQNPSQYQHEQHIDQDDFEDGNDDGSDDSHMNDDDDESDEEGGVDADKLQSNVSYSEEQLNNILDRGGVLPQFEDHDLSSTGGLSKQELSSFPETRHEGRVHGHRRGTLDEDRIKCSICMSKYKVRQIVLTIGCMHRFHKKCIVSWLKKNTKCPICKEDQKKFLKGS